MTKDGRPSRINDIRYFFGDRYSYHNDQAVIAFGRRLAWFLNGEGFCLGSYPALYIFFTSLIEPGFVEVTGRGGDWWQRYTDVGVPKNFPDISDASEFAMQRTIAALKAIRPDFLEIIDGCAQLVWKKRDSARILIKSRVTKRFNVEISFTIAEWPQSSSLFVSLTDRADDAYFEAPAIPMRFYTEAFDLSGTIKVALQSLEIKPNKSVGAQLSSAYHGGPIINQISEFMPTERPVFSKLVKRRG